MCFSLFSTRFLILFYCVLWFMGLSEKKDEKEDSSGWLFEEERGRQALFVNLPSLNIHPYFFVQSDHRKWCLPTRRLVKKEEKSQGNVHRAGAFTLCPLPLVLPPKPPLCGQRPLSWWPGKSGAGWSCQSLTLFLPVFGDLFSLL